MPSVAPPGRADRQMRPCGRIDARKTSLGIFMAMGDIASSKQSHDKPPASGHGTREGFYPATRREGGFEHGDFVGLCFRFWRLRVARLQMLIAHASHRTAAGGMSPIRISRTRPVPIGGLAARLGGLAARLLMIPGLARSSLSVIHSLARQQLVQAILYFVFGRHRPLDIEV
jgi:hypothetical protein